MPDSSQKNGDIGGVSLIRPRKRLHLSRECKVGLQYMTVDNTMDIDGMNGRSNIICSDERRNDVVICGLAQGDVAAVSTEDVNIRGSECTAVGSVVEVLSQDSGMRGCWFRAVIIKKHKNKVKLRYHDIKDAEDEANCLEEWVLASRVANCDEMGLRTYGRTTIRPALLGDNGKVSWVINVGTFVDVWWHDGWWEGIVIHKGSDEQVRVYFPGEKREAVFCRSDLRHSQEWMGSTWKKLNESPNFAASILSDRMREGARATAKTNNVKQPQTVVCNDKRLEHGTVKNISPHVAQDCSPNLHTKSASSSYEKANSSPVLDLSKDDLLSRLKWSSSCKRKRNMFLVQKLQPRGRNRVSSGRIRRSHQDFLIPSTLMKIKNDGCKSAKCDPDNCKYISDSLFSSSVVPALTNLVMSR